MSLISNERSEPLRLRILFVISVRGLTMREALKIATAEPMMKTEISRMTMVFRELFRPFSNSCVALSVMRSKLSVIAIAGACVIALSTTDIMDQPMVGMGAADMKYSVPFTLTSRTAESPLIALYT